MNKVRSDIYCVDCTDYMRGLPDKSVDLAIVDPPYADPFKEIDGGKRFGERFDAYKKNTVSRTEGTWAEKYGKKIIDWDVAPKPDYFEQLFRVSKNQIIWGGNYFDLPPTRCFIVWEKTNIPENFSMAMAEYAWTSFHKNAQIFRYTSLRQGKDHHFHPTEKPVALYAWLLKNYANQGDTILDTHLGSGSSRIAAYKMGFDFVGCEIDKEYFDKSNTRFRCECLGEYVDKSEKIIKEQELF